MRRFRLLSTLLALLAAAPAFAQSESALREAFEGKRVRVKIDMPATSAGVDIRPERKPPVDFKRLGDLMKREGISLQSGDAALVTKVKVAKSLVEFQLDGGGYGTFGDMLNSSPESNSTTLGKSGKEKQLEDQIHGTSDPGRKKALERELKDERNRREADNARAQAEANQANQIREGNIQQQRLHGGSRFTLRFTTSVPAELLTSEGLRRALADYVDFSDTEPAPATSGATSLRKGLSIAEVERLLGPAAEATEKREGSLLIRERTYRRGDETVIARFVDDVLVKYTIFSN